MLFRDCPREDIALGIISDYTGFPSLQYLLFHGRKTTTYNQVAATCRRRRKKGSTIDLHDEHRITATPRPSSLPEGNNKLEPRSDERGELHSETRRRRRSSSSYILRKNSSYTRMMLVQSYLYIYPTTVFIHACPFGRSGAL